MYVVQRQITGSAGSTTSATRLSHHIPVSRQLASKLLVVGRRVAIFGHIARLSEEVPAHQALCAYVDLSLGGLPSRDWKRRPGRPNKRWVDQIRNNTGNMPSTLWRSAILPGHGSGLRSDATALAGYANMVMI